MNWRKNDLKQLKTYPIHQCAFYKCKSKKKLARLLKTDLNNLNRLSKSIEQEYYTFNNKRQITAPKKELKVIQKRVLNLLNKIEKPDWVISSTKEKSYLDNAHYHIGAQYVCTTDIRSFYNNCSRDRVYQFFAKKLLTSPDVAKLLSDITTLNYIPTGSPSSQILAYFAYEEMFINMFNVSQEFNCKMTLYVDDLTFSKGNSFNYQKLINYIDIEARKFDHSLKYKETNYKSVKKGAKITGVILKNHELKIPNNLRMSILKDFEDIKNNQERKHQVISLKGKINAARLIEPNHFNGTNSYVKKL